MWGVFLIHPALSMWGEPLGLHNTVPACEALEKMIKLTPTHRTVSLRMRISQSETCAQKKKEHKHPAGLYQVMEMKTATSDYEVS